MGSMGSVLCQIVPSSGLYLVSRSIAAPQIHSLSNSCRVSFCFTCHSWGGSPFFVYFAFLCLQVSSVSNFCPDTSGQRLTCSTAVERNGHCKQIPLACVGSAFSGWMDHTGFATAHGDMYFPGPHCSASRVLCKGTVPGEPCILSTSQV